MTPVLCVRSRSDEELLALVAFGQPSPLEIELADRLEKALECIDDLQDELDDLREEIAELRADGDDEEPGL